MSGMRWNTTRQAVKLFLGRLAHLDVFSVILFNNDVKQITGYGQDE